MICKFCYTDEAGGFVMDGCAFCAIHETSSTLLPASDARAAPKGIPASLLSEKEVWLSLPSLQRSQSEAAYRNHGVRLRHRREGGPVRTARAPAHIARDPNWARGDPGCRARSMRGRTHFGRLKGLGCPLRASERTRRTVPWRILLRRRRFFAMHRRTSHRRQSR